MVGEYVKKPVVVEALLWTGVNVDEALEFCGIRAALTVHEEESKLFVNTLEDWVRCPVGHLIVKGVRGEVYPCDPGIFEETYNSV